MNKATQQFSQWLDNSIGRVKSAHVKLAADDEAISGIKDPTCKGTVSIPSHVDGNNRSALGLPENTDNFSEPDKQHHIFGITQPNGVGQGSYPTPRNGNAKEDAATSPTVPLDKIAGIAASLTQSLNGVNAAPVAESNVQVPANLYSDQDLMSKLASIGAFMVGSTEGQQAVAEALEREAGIKEASALISHVNEQLANEMNSQYYNELQLQKQAADQHAAQYHYAMQKQAADEMAHAAWYNNLSSDLEKMAYAQGAADGAAMGEEVAAGGDATIPGADAVSDEDVLGVIQQMVESGEISQEEAEALLQTLTADGQAGGELEALAAELQQAVESGAIDAQTAEALAQAIMEDAGMVGDAEAGAEDPAAAAAAQGVEKAAAVLNSLF